LVLVTAAPKQNATWLGRTTVGPSAASGDCRRDIYGDRCFPRADRTGKDLELPPCQPAPPLPRDVARDDRGAVDDFDKRSYGGRCSDRVVHIGWGCFALSPQKLSNFPLEFSVRVEPKQPHPSLSNPIFRVGKGAISAGLRCGNQRSICSLRR
jgi:hypothetical protein